MKSAYRTSILILSVLLLFSFPAVTKAQGMEAYVEQQEVSKGDEIPLKVVFHGRDIWFAMVKISVSSQSVEGGGSFLIEPERGQSEVEESYVLYAVSPGTAVITVEGYTDEDESEIYRTEIKITVADEESDRTDPSPGRGAAADENYQIENGGYINQKDPAEETTTSSERVTKESEKSGKTETKTEAESSPPASKQTKKETKKGAPIAVILVIAAVVLAAAAAAIFVIRKKKTVRRTEEEIEKTETEDEKKHE